MPNPTLTRCRNPRCCAPISSRAVCNYCRTLSPAGRRIPLHEALEHHATVLRRKLGAQRDLAVGLLTGAVAFAGLAVFLFVIGVLTTGGVR